MYAKVNKRKNTSSKNPAGFASAGVKAKRNSLRRFRESLCLRVYEETSAAFASRSERAASSKALGPEPGKCDTRTPAYCARTALFHLPQPPPSARRAKYSVRIFKWNKTLFFTLVGCYSAAERKSWMEYVNCGTLVEAPGKCKDCGCGDLGLGACTKTQERVKWEKYFMHDHRPLLI